MTEELSVQQRPSAVPYVLGGGAVGALGGHIASKKYAVTPAKYDSYEALIKEASDKDAFTKAIAEATEAEKPLMEKAKTIAEKAKTAETEWQTKLDDYLVKEGALSPDTDDIKQLTQELETLKSRVANNEKLSAASSKTEVLKQVLAEKEAALSSKEELAKLAEDIATATKEVKKAQGAHSGLQTKVTLPEITSLKKELARQQNELKINQELNQKLKELRGKKQTKAVKEEILKIEQALEARKQKSPELAIKKIKQLIGRLPQEEKALNSFLDEQARIVAEAYGTPNQVKAVTDAQRAIQDKVNSLAGISKVDKKKVLDSVQKEFNNRVAVMDRSLPAEIRLKELTDKFNGLSETKKKIVENHGSKLKDSVKATQKEVNELNQIKDLATRREQHIKKMWAERKAVRALQDKKVVDLTVGEAGKQKFEYKSFTDGLTTSEKGLLKKYHSLKGKAVGADSGLEAQKEKIKELTETIAEKRKALPKDASKSVEELTEKFVKENGTKEDAVKKVTDGLKDDVSKLFEGVKNNKKAMAIMAGVTAAGVALGLMIRPKAKEQKA